MSSEVHRAGVRIADPFHQSVFSSWRLNNPFENPLT
jgi:hypothetical protein